MCYTIDKKPNVSLYVQNVNNLFDSPDFWHMKNKTTHAKLYSKTTHALTSAPVVKYVVFVLS